MVTLTIFVKSHFYASYIIACPYYGDLIIVCLTDIFSAYFNTCSLSPIFVLYGPYLLLSYHGSGIV